MQLLTITFSFPHPLSERTRFRTLEESRNTVRGDKSIIYRRRHPEDQYVNPYNPFLLRAWQANIDVQAVSNPRAAAFYMMEYVTKGEKTESKVVQEALQRLNPQATTRQVYSAIGNAILSKRQVSKQECMMLLRSDRLYYGSRGTVTIAAVPPHKRQVRTLPLHLLQEKEPDDQNIFTQNLIDHYSSRPDGEIWDDITLFEFASFFMLTAEELSRAGPDDEFPIENHDDSTDEEQQHHAVVTPDTVINPDYRIKIDQPPFLKTNRCLPRFTLKNGKIIRMRKKMRSVLTPSGAGSSIDTKYAMLMLYVPFRNEARDILDVDLPYNVDNFAQLVISSLERHRTTIDRIKQHLPSAIKSKIEEVLILDNIEEPFSIPIETLRTLTLPDPDLHSTVITTESGIETDDIIDTISATQNTIIPQQSAQVQSLEQILQQANLSADQQAVLVPFKNYLINFGNYLHNLQRIHSDRWAAEALRIQIEDTLPKRPAPPHVFMTGSAGTGKSYVIKVLKTMFEWWSTTNRHRSNEPVLLCAPTGVAAFNINGQTLHSALTMPVEKRGAAQEAGLTPNALRTLRERFRNTLLIIVDEVSMMGDRVLHQLNQRLNHIFEPDLEGMDVSRKVYGDRAVLFVGDPAQLPPVCASFYFDDTINIQVGPYHLFKSYFHPVLLTVQHRQSGDNTFAELLNRVRLQQQTEEDIKLLYSRSLEIENPEKELILQQYHSQEWRKAVHLYPTKAEVASYNEESLTRLSIRANATLYRIIARDTPTEIPDSVDSDNTGGLPKYLTIAIGAEIMIRQNIDVKDGLHNGARGVIVGISWPDGVAPTQSITPGPSNTITTKIVPSIWVSFHDDRVGRSRPSRLFNNTIRAIEIVPICISFEYARASVTRYQLPLLIAFAMTIHKSQSLTLDKVVIQAGKHKFNPGQLYVALSRAKRLEDIILLQFNPQKIKIAQKVRQEMQRLQELPPPSVANAFATTMITFNANQ